MKRIVSLLRDKKMIVIGWEDWYGGNVNPMSEKPYYTDGHPDDIDLREAQNFGRRMIENCIKISEGDSSLIPQLQQGKDYIERYGGSDLSSMTKGSQKEKNVSKPGIMINRDICNFPTCSLCKDNCPSGSIDPFSENPQDKASCEVCHFCEEICPTGAITFSGRMHINKNNPIVKKLVDDLMEHRELRRFRPLVSFDEVGTIKPSEKDIDKHPQLILHNGVGFPVK